MAVPGFTTVVGAVATDSGNGATAWNSIATQTEANYPKFNAWAAAAQGAFPIGSVVVKGAALITPASGWAMEGQVYRECWAKKWGGVTYVSLAMKRTGATIAAKTGGNIDNSTIGTLAAGYRPLDNMYPSVTCASGGLYQISIDTNGVIVLYSAAGNYGLPASRSLLWSMLFPNSDLKAF